MTSLANQELEWPACPLCGARSCHGTGYSFPPLAVRRCADCGLWYLTPRLAERAMHHRYRQPAYFTGGGESGYVRACTSYAAQETALRLTFRHFLRRLAAVGLAGGSLLEIGCGYGYFLDEATPYFSRLTGTELNPEAAAAARRPGMEVVEGGIESLPLDWTFNTIISICVIEHIYEPRSFLRQLARSLVPGGWMIHATPLMDSPWLKLLGRRWPSFKVPEHVAFYDQAHLNELLQRAGALEIKAITYPHAFSLGAIAEKLGFSLPETLARRLIFLPGTMCAVAARFSRE